MLRYAIVFLAIIGMLLTAGLTSPGFHLKRELAQNDLERGDRSKLKRDYQHAIKAYSRAIETRELDKPVLAYAYAQRAECRRHLVYMTGGSDEALIEALNDAHEAIQLSIHEASYFRSRARIYTFLGAYPEAFSDLESAMRLEQKDPFWPLIDKGSLQRTLGDYEGALETFRSVLQERSKKRSMPPRFHMALVYMDQGKYADAVNALDEGLKVRPGHSDALFERGCAKANLGHYAEALADYRKGVELYDDLDHFDPPYPAEEHDDRIHREELNLLHDIVEGRIVPDKEQIRALCTRSWSRNFEKKRERSKLLPE